MPKTKNAPPEAPKLSFVRELVGCDEARLMPWTSSTTWRTKWTVVCPDGRVFSIGRRKKRGPILADERKPGEPDAKIHVRKTTDDNIYARCRLVALAFLGPPPTPNAQATYDGDWPTREAVYWTTQAEAARERASNAMSPTERHRRDTRRTRRKMSEVRITHDLAAALLDQLASSCREHGMSYTVESIVRDRLGLAPLPTPAERRAALHKGSATAGILTAARKEAPSIAEIAERTGKSEGHVGRILYKNRVSLRDVRARKERLRTLRRVSAQNRDRNIVTDAKSGLFSLRELSERYGVSFQHVGRVLDREGLSLAQIKREIQEGINR